MAHEPKNASLELERDLFLRQLLRDLSGTLEDVVGLEAAEGYFSTVGGSVGQWIDTIYRDALNKDRLSSEEVSEVCIDLKRRIGGDFYLISADEDQFVYGNRRCPFGDKVVGRPSLCMMTSNVFGRITADNLGYARIELENTIARGDKGCRVVVRLKKEDDTSPNAREYYGGSGSLNVEPD